MIQTSFFIILQKRERKRRLLEQVESGEIVGYINDVVIYGYLRAVTGMKPFKLRREIAKMNIDLSPVKELLEIGILPCNFGIDIAGMTEMYELLPNDALIAATCKHYGIRKISGGVDFLEIVGLWSRLSRHAIECANDRTHQHSGKFGFATLLRLFSR